jgi:hypothetical protein
MHVYIHLLRHHFSNEIHHVVSRGVFADHDIIVCRQVEAF